jgi:hypothetical protein
MATLDRLDDMEEFVLALRPQETFRPNRLWQTPLNGLHDYVLPETIAERLAPIEELARDVAASPVELLVTVTDVTDDGLPDELHAYERVYSSRTTPVPVMARAVLASAAISALVLPLRVGDVIGTDGGWVRNFPSARRTTTSTWVRSSASATSRARRARRARISRGCDAGSSRSAPCRPFGR